MKKFGLILVAFFCFGVFNSEVMAASLDRVFVTSDVYEYDQGDFPGLPGGSRILIGSGSYVPTEPVTVDSTPTKNGAFLAIPLSGWDMWLGVFSSPAIGNDWAVEYTFHADTESVTLNLESCTFHVLDIPQGVSFIGNTISWDPVTNATSYKLRWFHWNNGATPDMSSGFLAKTDYLVQPSYTMTNPVPGEYALRVEAFEFCGENPVNKSQLYVKQVIYADLLTDNCFVVSPMLSNVVIPGGILNLSVQTIGNDNISWNAASDSSWLTITSGVTGVGSGSVVIDVDPNEGVTREAKIVLTSIEAINTPQSVTIRQMGSNTIKNEQIAAMSAVATPTFDGIFPRVVNDTSAWIGIGIVNPSEVGANVTLSAFSDFGEVVAVENITLGAKERFLFVPAYLFSQDISSAGYIRYLSDQKLIGFQLNSSNSGYDFAALPVPSEIGVSLYFPRVLSDANWWNIIAIINSSGNVLEGSLTFYSSSSGAVVHVENVTLPAFGRKEWLIVENGGSINLPSGDYLVCFEPQAQTLAPTGYLMMGNSNAISAIPAIADGTIGDLYLSRVLPSGGSMWQGIALANLSSQTANLLIEDFLGAPVPIIIPAHCVKTFLLSDYFIPQTVYPGNLVIRNPENVRICGFEIFGDGENAAGCLLKSETDAVTTLYYPHSVQSNGWDVDFIAMNHGETATALTLYPYDTSGQPLATKQYFLAAKDSLIGLASTDLPLDTAWFRLESSDPFFGHEVIRQFTECNEDFDYFFGVDFNNDGTHDIALFYPSSSKWYIKDQSTPTYGTSDCLPVPGDYDGDGTTDLAVVDLTRSDGRAKWYLDGIGVFIYGLQEWIPVPGDYDGDGVADAALFDQATGKWYVKDQFVTTFGAGGIPVPGDYNGDYIIDIAVFYPATNKWYIKDVGTYTYGMADCIPVPADYDGDGITDIAVIDTSRSDGMAKWYIRDQAVFIYGAVADTIPVPGDYDGDGDADPCLFYQNFGKWYARNVGVWTYGNSDMIPLADNLATRYAIKQAEGGGSIW